MKITRALLKSAVFIGFSFIFIHCKSDKQNNSALSNPLFTALSATKTGVDFQNTLTEGLNTNVLMYEYFYNGGGVAIGDLNNDGLDDIYFTANMTSNKLYLNKGKMVFQDITNASGAGGRESPWKTGVTMADVNGDGLLDIMSVIQAICRLKNGRINCISIQEMMQQTYHILKKKEQNMA